jgi:6-pyruvoyltetrahydropterin/6-carboxytetrahydropterin synthase
MTVYLSRKETFSAAHRIHSSQLTDKENTELFGKCNSPNYHGHNYTVEIVIKGKVDKRTGTVMNMSILKEAMRVGILEKLDHKNIDLDVPDFKEISTTENLAVYIWNSIKWHLPNDVLYEVRLQETEKNAVFYRGS